MKFLVLLGSSTSIQKPGTESEESVSVVSVREPVQPSTPDGGNHSSSWAHGFYRRGQRSCQAVGHTRIHRSVEDSVRPGQRVAMSSGTGGRRLATAVEEEG